MFPPTAATLRICFPANHRSISTISTKIRVFHFGSYNKKLAFFIQTIITRSLHSRDYDYLNYTFCIILLKYSSIEERVTAAPIFIAERLLPVIGSSKKIQCIVFSSLTCKSIIDKVTIIPFHHYVSK